MLFRSNIRNQTEIVPLIIITKLEEYDYTGATAIAVLMLVEILHTVRVSIRSGQLSCEPFLIVGLIASIRRVLVITLETSQATKGGSLSEASEGVFRASMIELGVLAVLIMVMVVSIYILHRSGASGTLDKADSL